MTFVLFDSGATFSCLRPDIAEAINIPEILGRPIESATASEGQYIKITEALPADFYYNDIMLNDKFMAVTVSSAEEIICMNIMQKWWTKLYDEHDTIMIQLKVAKLIF